MAVRRRHLLTVAIVAVANVLASPTATPAAVCRPASLRTSTNHWWAVCEDRVEQIVTALVELVPPDAEPEP